MDPSFNCTHVLAIYCIFHTLSFIYVYMYTHALISNATTCTCKVIDICRVHVDYDGQT